MNSVSAHLIGAIRGPVLLITFGGLLALDHARGPSFGQTWPALIIVFGVMKLLERVFAPRSSSAGYQAPAGPAPPTFTQGGD